MRSAACLMLVLLGCGGSSEVNESSSATPAESAPSSVAALISELEDPPFPDTPPGVRGAVETCVRDYRSMAVEGFPDRAPSQSLDSWTSGPFNAWTAGYNALRARCDDVSADLEPSSVETQLMFASQGYVHERLGQLAVPFDEDPQMFLMARYWTLGAACTYENCMSGPDEAWTRFCTERRTHLPECPPPATQPGHESPP